MGFIDRILFPFKSKQPTDVVAKATATTMAMPNDVAHTNSGVTSGYGYTDIINVIGGGLGSSKSFLCKKGIQDALTNCPPVEYLLHRKAMAFANGKLTAKNAKGEDVTETFEYAKLLKNPNYLMTEAQFKIHVKMVIEAYGYCPCVVIRPVGFSKGISAIWPLNPNAVNFNQSSNFLNNSSYKSTFSDIKVNIGNGKAQSIASEDFYVFTDLMPYTLSNVLPQSRIAGLGYEINNIAKIHEACSTILSNRGAIGAWVNNVNDTVSNIPMDPEEKKEVLDDLHNNFGLTKGKYQFAVSTKNIRWENASYPIKDLMLTEMEENHIMTICDAIGYPYPLLSRGSETSFNNQETAERGMYQNFVIPEAKNFEEQLTDMLDLSKVGITLSYDYSHLPCLQANLKEQSETFSRNVDASVELFRNNGCTYKAYLQFNNQDASKAPELFFYQMPIDFQASFTTNSNNRNEKGN